MKAQVIILLLSVMMAHLDAIEVQCKPEKRRKQECIIQKLNGDFANQTVIIRNKNPQNITKIIIDEVNLGRLPPSIFDTFTHLKSLALNKCGLTSMDGLKQSQTLMHLYFNGNNLTDFEGDQLPATITSIQARDNHIRRINKTAFEKLAHLSRLDLANNHIRKIKREMIVPTLTSINLEGNQLRKIDRIFNKHGQLKHLGLARNQIGRTISDKIFAGLKPLKKLDLSHNLIEVIDCGAFKDATDLRLLKLNNNKLKKISLEVTSRMLKLVYLHENNLHTMCVTSTLPTAALANLKVVAHNNELSNIRFSDGLPITALVLDHNDITQLDFVVNVPQLEQLSLSSNDLVRANFSNLAVTSVNRLILEGTNLRPIQFKIILSLKQLTNLLNVSNNKQLATFNFSKTRCVVAELYLNRNNVAKVNVKSMKKSFKNLKELHVSDNRFDCAVLKDQEERIRDAGVVVKCKDLILK